MISKTICFFLVCMAIAGKSTISIAGVNQKNGNFHISYTDVIYGSIDIMRTYNSRAGEKGAWGVGWGSDMETYLISNPNGSPVIHYNGNGATKYFIPQDNVDQYQQQGDKSLNQMLDIYVSSNPKEDPIEYRQQLIKKLQDRRLRQAYWEKLLQNGKILPIPIGHTFKYRCSCGYDESHLVKLINGYRLDNTNKKLFFDNDGLLSSIKFNDKPHLKYRRDEEGKNKNLIRSITDGKNVVYFFYNKQGRVIRIFSGKKWIYYRYDRKGDLIYSKDAGDNEYIYSYDDNHNLTKVKYQDDSEMVIEYSKKSQLVKKLISKYGAISEYEYGKLPPDPTLHYFTRLKRGTSPNISVEYIEFHFDKDENGAEIKTAEITVADSIRREVYFNKQGVPERVKRSSKRRDETEITAIVDYKIDNAGRISKASSGEWVRQYEYIDTEHSKIKKMTQYLRGEQQEYIFNYDAQFRLISARLGVKNIAIKYRDKEGATVLSLSGNHNKLTFNYENDKIIKIQLNNDTATPIRYTQTGKMVLENTDPTKVLQISALMSGNTRITSIAQTGLEFGKTQ